MTDKKNLCFCMLLQGLWSFCIIFYHVQLIVCTLTHFITLPNVNTFWWFNQVIPFDIWSSLYFLQLWLVSLYYSVSHILQREKIQRLMKVTWLHIIPIKVGFTKKALCCFLNLIFFQCYGCVLELRYMLSVI